MSKEEDAKERARIYRKKYYKLNKQKLLKYQKAYYVLTKYNSKNYLPRHYTKKFSWKGEKTIGGYTTKPGPFTIKFE